MLKFVPEEIILCEFLQELDLSDNQLTTLPSDIGQLQTLRVLLAHNNAITEVATEISYLRVGLLPLSSVSDMLIGFAIEEP